MEEARRSDVKHIEPLTREQVFEVFIRGALHAA
jgi:hypothetical protein